MPIDDAAARLRAQVEAQLPRDDPKVVYANADDLRALLADHARALAVVEAAAPLADDLTMSATWDAIDRVTDALAAYRKGGPDA